VTSTSKRGDEKVHDININIEQDNGRNLLSKLQNGKYQQLKHESQVSDTDDEFVLKRKSIFNNLLM